MKKYFENLYNILFAPNEAFENIEETTTMPVAVLTLVLTNTVMFLLKSTPADGFLGGIFYFFGYVGFIFGTMFTWFLTAIFFEIIAKIFSKSGKLRILLKRTSYVCLPVIFFAPFELLKQSSDTGYFFGTKFEILLYFWMIFLYAKSLEKTYDLKFSSSLLLIFLPLIAFIFFVIRLMGSFFDMGYIYSV